MATDEGPSDGRLRSRRLTSTFLPRFLLAFLAAVAFEGANSLLPMLSMVVTLEPLPAVPFLSGVLFGWTGIFGSLIGQISYRLLLLDPTGNGSLDLYRYLGLPLSYLPIGIVGYLAFRLIPEVGRGFPNARSYGALVLGGVAGGVVTSLVLRLLPLEGLAYEGGFLVQSASNLVSILLLGPPVLLIASRWLRPLMVPIPEESSLPTPFPANLDLHGLGPQLEARMVLFLLALITITATVVPLAKSTPQVGGWTLLGYLGLVVWAAMAHGLRGGLLATSFSGILYLAGRAYIDRDLLPDDPDLYAVGLYADFVVFSVVAVVVGAGREEEISLRRDREQREHQLTILNEMADLLQSSLSFEEAYRIIKINTRRLFPRQSGALSMLRDAELLEAAVTWGTPTTETFFRTGGCWALRRGQPYLTRAGGTKPFCPHFPQATGETFCVPLVAQGETLGVLHLEDPNRLSQRLRDLALSAAKQIDLALANLRLRESLRQQSIRDALTGLFNRRYMSEVLRRETYRSQREGEPFVLVLFDIDHFKKFNDTYGHEAGDLVLRRIAGYLQEQTRPQEIFCRWGGEEFVHLQLGASLEDGRDRAEDIRCGVRALEMEYEGLALGPVTLSLGVAAFPSHGEREEDVLRAADEALYRAKARGRDQVVLAEEVISDENLDSTITH